MTALLLVILSCLAVQTIIADNSCKTPKSILDDIDVQKLQNVWKTVYVNSKQMAAEYSCWSGEIGAASNGVIPVQASIIVNSGPQNVTYSGSVQKWNGHYLNLTLSESDVWSTSYNVLALGDKMLIVSGCPPATGGQPVIIVQFTTWTPDEETMNAAKKAFAELNLDTKDFNMFCPLTKTQ
ncbi:uncharacterized protein [Periplaneta americana]|uniref:uncharacterized protein isoform X1 n=1 Tax=Periplaneta americana TaxID=6978 RepID=UPI0037E7F6B0